MRPPSSKKARMTSAQASRATGSSPTLNVIQLPSPITGMASPLDSIGLVRIARCCADAGRGRNIAAAPVAANAWSTLRRVNSTVPLTPELRPLPSHSERRILERM
jgi:hypothetical protein